MAAVLPSSVLPKILGSGFDDPYPVYRQLRESAPVQRDASGMWLVSSHAAVTQMLDDPRFSARPPASAHVEDPLGYLGMVVFQAGEAHDRVRRLLAPLFSRKRLADVQERIDAKLRMLLAPLQSSAGSMRDAAFDLIERIAGELPVWTICELLGFPASAASAYLEASTGAWRLISAASMSAQERMEAVVQTQRFMQQIEAIIAGVDADATPDHPALYFRQMVESGEMAPREMLANVLFLFIAGYGTTLLSIGNSVGAAVSDRALWQALRDDPARVPAAARELQRYDAAVQSVFRYAWEDVEIGSQRIRRGDMAVLLLGSANRDPAEFDHPERIDLHRSRGRSLTYGAGPHSCMGVALARMQLESVLRALLDRAPALRLCETRASTRLQRGAFHGFSALWLQP